MAFFQKRQTTENERRKALGKFKRKRWLAGAMAFMLCCTSFLQTGVLAVSAQDEIVQEEVQTLKSEEELIEETAVDPALAITLEQGKAFDVQKDVTGLNLKEGEQMELKKAEMEDWHCPLIPQDQVCIDASIGLHQKAGKPTCLPEPLQ